MVYYGFKYLNAETDTAMRKELLAFDLDGTLIDSSLDIAWSANKTLKAFGYRELDAGYIKDNIGWGVRQLLEKLMPGSSPDAITMAREKFLEFYAGHLVVDTFVYPGVRDTIKHFSAMSKKMVVVTNKPEGLALRILEEVSLSAFISMTVGGDSTRNRKPHPEPLEKAVAALGVPLEKTVFIGDSPIDCETGKKAGVSTVGVSYGFRDRRELEEAGFDVIIDKFSDLKAIIK